MTRDEAIAELRRLAHDHDQQAERCRIESVPDVGEVRAAIEYAATAHTLGRDVIDSACLAGVLRDIVHGRTNHCIPPDYAGATALMRCAGILEAIEPGER